jgi:monoamine oxidase
VPFWKGLETGAPYPGYPPSCLEDGAGPIVPPMESPPTREMVDIANQQVAAVHALPQVPIPYSAVYHTWNEDPYGGGWHEWKADYRLDRVMCRMRKPVADQDIHIVGEAYSFDQGWVEGSLDTAESTLQEFFGLARPTWISKPGYALMPIPCPGGCESVDGCIKVEKAAKTLAAITPNCLAQVEEG